jgi:hypothetical protein
MTYNAIRTTVTEGKVETDLALFNGQEVIIVSRDTWNAIAGSDSVRYQLEQALARIKELEAGVTE